MDLSPEVTEIIEKEERILADVLASLRQQLVTGEDRLFVESGRSKDLTQTLVAATRDEDKQMIASDEAVSHRLRDMKADEVSDIKQLLARPYFARIELEEEVPAGTRTIEYKLGARSNTDCRIIDWRKGPVAKLYYEYEAGEEYSELIQGRERNGTIKVRHKVEIEDGKLVRLSCGLGNFVCENGSWRALQAGEKFGSRSSYGALPDVRSLMTPEQFQLVTEDPETPLLLRGRAGSGKTTVALHRIDWLLKECADSITAKDCLILVQSGGLKSYIQGALQDLEHREVRVVRMAEWMQRETARALGQPKETVFERPRADGHPSLGLVKQSPAILSLVEQVAPSRQGVDPREVLLEILSMTSELMARDRSGMVDIERVSRSLTETKKYFVDDEIALDDEPLLVRIAQLQGTLTANYKHLVVDEVQDTTPPQLAASLGAVDNMKHLTLVGDEAQGIRERATYFGWEDLKKQWDEDENLARLATLSVSHRSTKPIVNLADYVADRKFVRDGRPGKRPLWFHCKREDQAIEEALGWLERVSEAQPGALTVVVCQNRSEALSLVGMFEPTFGPSVRFGDRASLSFEEGILVTEVRAVKGLEFPHVMVWNASKENYPEDDRGRGMLYVAISRAENLLSLVTWGKTSRLLPPFRSKLVRVVNRTIEDEEEE